MDECEHDWELIAFDDNSPLPDVYISECMKCGIYISDCTKRHAQMQEEF